MTDPLAALKARFVARAAEDLEALRADDDPDHVRHVVHRLSGTAGVFGFADLSRLARVIDDQFETEGAPRSSDLQALDAELEAVTRPRG